MPAQDGRQPDEKRGQHDAIDEEILEQAADWRRQGKGVALATVVGDLGLLAAARRQPARGRCRRRACSARSPAAASRARWSKEAQEVIADGKPRLLDFGVTNEQAWEVGLACGGKLQVFLERVE